MRTEVRAPRNLVLALLLTAISCSRQENRPDSTPLPAVQTVAPIILRTLPHDPTAFTQGLLHHDEKLYESTGAPEGRESSLRVSDAVTGAGIQMVEIPSLFAEGIAAYRGRLVQLTWRSQRALVYSFPELEYKGTVPYEGEGWGLTAYPGGFIMSSGSDTLQFRDSSFAVTRRLAVTLDGRPLRSLNELEYVAGTVYANVWYSSYIFAVSAQTGRVTAMIDCAALIDSAGPESEHDVLNGIAYNDSAGTFFVTGKNWRVMFEVRLP